MAERLALLTSDHGVSGANLNGVSWQRALCSHSHRTDMTENCWKERKAPNQSFVKNDEAETHTDMFFDLASMWFHVSL